MKIQDEGIQEIQNDKINSPFPNPTSDELLVKQKIKTDKQLIQVYDFIGRLVFENLNFTGPTIETRQLNNKYLFEIFRHEKLLIEKICSATLNNTSSHEFNVGIQVKTTYDLKQIDEYFFDER